MFSPRTIKWHFTASINIKCIVSSLETENSLFKHMVYLHQWKSTMVNITQHSYKNILPYLKMCVKNSRWRKHCMYFESKVYCLSRRICYPLPKFTLLTNLLAFLYFNCPVFTDFNLEKRGITNNQSKE